MPLLLGLALTCMVAGSQEGTDQDIVFAPVLVIDRQNHPLRGLDVTDFRLFEDGLEQPIVFFSSKGGRPRRPLSSTRAPAGGTNWRERKKQS